ncbi:hypothetical protein HKX48_009553 [Thoreauomyces humboldtii]|nr:hypothetical protein HKX48_009553 [Thoreauomyces humboldtii]
MDDIPLAPTPAPFFKCPYCRKKSPHVYRHPLCLRNECDHFWKSMWTDNPPSKLRINDAFLLPFGDPGSNEEKQLITRVLPGTKVPEDEASYPKALCCGTCGRISSREHMTRWICASGCGNERLYPSSTSTPLVITTPFDFDEPTPRSIDNVGCVLLREGSGIMAYKNQIYAPGSPHHGCRSVIYVLPTGGTIEHVLANETLNKIGWTVFEDFRESVPFKRWRHNAHRVKGFMTQNFCHNAGEAYRHSINLPASPFEASPSLLLARHVLQAVSPEKNINEMLSILYLNGQRMAFHDDGEKEVAGPIVGWSLGSDSTMRFRRKNLDKENRRSKSLRSQLDAAETLVTMSKEPRGAFEDEDVCEECEGGDNGTWLSEQATFDKSGTAPATSKPRNTALELLTRHGDLVIMRGKAVQTWYEHAADPHGVRLCVTGRTMRRTDDGPVERMDVEEYRDDGWEERGVKIEMPVRKGRRGMVPWKEGMVVLPEDLRV